MIKNKKASAFAWFAIMLAIFGMGLIYVILNQPYQEVKEYVHDNMTGSRYENTYNQIDSVWNMWLVIALIGLIIMGIITALDRREENLYL